MSDPTGWRSGFATSYGSLTLGVTVKPNALTVVRPEIRFEKAFRPGVTPYDNGLKASQATFGFDWIRNF